jgi:alkanesulfonate monooxygenase SsuD/methylene tetrahydromethanopterin reductase-like flavin-dependent oxidoreductase (luciferase family)
MIEIAYSLSAEEHSPAELVRQAIAAEEAGFSFALVSDQFHPWTDRQGQSAFVRELPMPRHFRQATTSLTREQVAEAVRFDHVYVHQVVPDQRGFLRFYEREILARAAVR